MVVSVENGENVSRRGRVGWLVEEMLTLLLVFVQSRRPLEDKDLENKTLECYRHKRLRGRHQMEMSSIASFYDCLGACMRRFGPGCRSIEYSHRGQLCRFSDRTVVGPLGEADREGLMDDDQFDYYQFMWNSKCSSPGPSIGFRRKLHEVR